jgi:GR25 family glycosyltransferase involved in LPS biosynthesis
MESGFMGTSFRLDANGELDFFHELIHKVGRTYFCHCMSRGAIGICLSHLSVLQDAYDSGYQTIWVMEDDIQVMQNPHILSQLIQELDQTVGKNNWDILCTDQDTRDSNGNYVPCMGMARCPNFHPKSLNQYYVNQKINRNFTLKGARFGAYSMIVRRSGMEKILNFMKKYKVFLPYDMTFNLPEGLKLYSVTTDVVAHQLGAASDNGNPLYLTESGTP